MQKTQKPMKARHSSPESGEAAALAHRTPAVARAATVLRLLVGQRSGLGVTEIARRVGLVPSTCLHVLRALVDEGFIIFDVREKTYRAGVGLFTLIRDVMDSTEFPQAVQPVLDRFSTSFHVTAIALELNRHDELIVVATSRTGAFVGMHIDIGTRSPAFSGAIGRCVAAMANLDREELRERFGQLQWERAPSFADWYADVERAKAEGAAVDQGQSYRGLSITSALVPIGMDRVIRGIALIGFEHLMTERTIRQLKRELISEVQAISDRLN
jgi:DNA-binding IclR family transcriptional regulator